MLLLFLLTNIFRATADNWAVLVAGSNGYYNYRHQADVCHAYQILHNFGFPDSNIITMMYDDIAHNTLNPFKGNIINRHNGKNVYENVLKDYTREQVNPENFMNILKGNVTENTPKVLKSEKNDNVFIYFTDHGGTGLIAFPEDYLFANQLNETLTYMYDNNMYKNMVFYLEACESGSMFNNILPENMNIYATTAATPYESSFACYFDYRRGIYLGDTYSVNWLENSMPVRTSIETVYSQFLIDRKKTRTSTVCEYGDKSVSKLQLDDFLMYEKNITFKTEPNIYFHINKYIQESDSRDVVLNTLMNQISLSNNVTKTNLLYIDLEKELVSREKYDLYFKDCVKSSENFCYGQQKINWDCYKKEINNFEKMNGKFTDYGLKYIGCLINLC